MSLFESIILGIIQGLTEFLPVSSSGHLELGKALLGDASIPQESMMFTVALHFATALSTMVVYRRDIGDLVMGLFQFENNEQWQYSLKILLSMIPAATLGVVFSEQLETLFDHQIMLVGFMLLLTGGLLLVADKASHTDRAVSWRDSLLIGVAQALAILPGISRSGATISTSVILGVDRSKAARFSFLMVVPLIFGKIAKDLIDGKLHYSDEQLTVLAAGFLAAFFTGLIACQWMIKLVRNSQLKYFSWYCFAVGSLAIGHQVLN